MLSRSCYLLGLFLVLLALMVQLSAGATGPRLDPVAQLVGAEMPCHMTEDAGNTPAKPPLHPAGSTHETAAVAQPASRDAFQVDGP